ncbi:MAG: fibronectin-binding autotransporter adhesin, partial [Phycisphaerales bacterium]|nr:fibronectin-binding autotransporter adhesin [Phycisphaerales bacterium]
QSGFGLAEGNAGIPAPTLQITALRDLNDSLTPPAAAHAGFFLRTATGTGPPFVDEIRADRTWAGVTPDGNLQQSWNQAGDGTWSTNTNWNDQVGGGVSAAAPNATGRVANFGTGIATGSTITVDADQTVDSLVFTNTGALTVSGNKLIVSSNASAGQIVAWAGNHTIGSALDMSGDSLAVKAAQGASLTLSGAITGTGKTLSKYGQGSVKLGASNLIADDVKLNVRSGPLDLNGNNETVDVVALGLGHPNPATAINNTPDLANGQIVGAGTLTANSYDLQSGTVSATLAGVNGVVKNNQATVTLSGTNAYTGNTVVNGGVLVLSGTNSNPVKAIVNAPFSPTNGGQSTLSVSADSNFGAVPASPVADSITVSGGARFRATADMVLNSNRGIVVNGTVASPTSPGLFDVSGGATLAYGGVVSGTAGVTKTGAGALLLSGANTYAGASNVVGGTAGSVLRIGADNSLPTGTTLGLNTLVPTGSATFDLGTPTSTGFNQTVAAVVNNSPLGAAAPTITNSGTAIRTFTINNATASTVAASMTGNLALAKSNAGTLTVTGANTYAGDTIARAGVISVANTGNLGSSTNGIVLAGGTLLNTGAIASSRNVSVDALGGTLETGADHTVGNITGAGALTKTSTGTLIANHVRTPSLTISAGTVKIASTGGVAAGTSVIDTYNLGANRLDITDNKLITTMLAGNADPETGVYSGVQGDIQRASNGGAWDAPGLTTSMPDAVTGLTSIGVATGEQIRGLGPTDTDLFAGQTINGASTIAMYTYAGDANLDGFISGDDYSTIDFNAGSSADGWVNGDFNYDGIVSGDDYSTIDFNYAAQGAPFPTSGSAGLSGVTAVPEPAALGLFGLAAAGLLARRRRAK